MGPPSFCLGPSGGGSVLRRHIIGCGAAIRNIARRLLTKKGVDLETARKLTLSAQ
jgi:hypothetical protein